MSATIPSKALISISSYHGVIYPDGTKTGLFYTEALHPYEVLTQAGFEVDLATGTGTYGLDDLSLTDQFLAGDDKAVFDNPDHPFNVKLNTALKKASDLNSEEYGLFFGSAGHAALYDYPTAKGLAAAAENVWTRGGAGRIRCGDKSTAGDGVVVEGMHGGAEVVLKLLDKLTADGVALVVDAVTKAAADYSSAAQRALEAFEALPGTPARDGQPEDPQVGVASTA
jgi:D-lactate dehydratase